MPENYQRQLLLFGWLPRSTVSTFVRDQCVYEEREREREILELWQRASDAFNAKPPRLFETIGIQPIDPKCEAKLKTIREDSRFDRTFSQLPSEFQLVEIDKLIACQATVTLEYVEKLIQGFPKELSTEALIEICLSLDKTVPEVAEMRINENSIIYSSENTDFRFLGAIQKPLEKSDLEASPGGIPTRGLLLLFGYGGSPINALKVGNRVFLNNGFHRVYALRKVGVTHIPLVSQRIDNPALQFPQIYQNIPREYLFQSERLPMMEDYFNNQIPIELRTKSRRRGVKVVWLSEPIDVPL